MWYWINRMPPNTVNERLGRLLILSSFKGAFQVGEGRLLQSTMYSESEKFQVFSLTFKVTQIPHFQPQMKKNSLSLKQQQQQNRNKNKPETCFWFYMAEKREFPVTSQSQYDSMSLPIFCIWIMLYYINLKDVSSGAQGGDSLTFEMCLFGVGESILKSIFEARTIPSIWCQGLISPLFKSDDKLNPENYRPICVNSCFCKLFCLLLNERLSLFLTENKIISPCQIGFQNKSRTTYHIFCLKSLLNKFVHNTESGKIYGCFVDFKKAYDTV